MVRIVARLEESSIEIAGTESWACLTLVSLDGSQTALGCHALSVIKERFNYAMKCIQEKEKNAVEIIILMEKWCSLYLKRTQTEDFTITVRDREANVLCGESISEKELKKIVAGID